MKKFYLSLVALMMLCISNASAQYVKNLYSQDFESVTLPAEAGWTSPNPAAMSVTGDEYGQYLQINHGATNGRSYENIWTSSIYGENASLIEDGKYTLSFEFCPKAATAEQKQTNSAVTVLSNGRCPENQPFIRRWSQQTPDPENEGQFLKNVGYLFDISMPDHVALGITPTTDKMIMFVNGDESDQITLENNWYIITLNVDVNARTVEYTVADPANEAIVTSGIRTVPEFEVDGTEISMYAEGLHVMCGRTSTNFLFDTINITCESSEAVANAPSVALSQIGKDNDGNLDYNLRIYTIRFMEGHLLKVKGTDGNVAEIQYDDCDNGAYEYSTTTSGTLVAWTEVGTAKSNEITMEVDCSPVALPAVAADVISVEEGFAKTYKLTVSNAEVPLSPTLFISYEFKGKNGATLSGEELPTGTTVTVPEAGTLTVTTSAFGYQATKTTIENNIEYEMKNSYDFARLTPEAIKAAGFAAIEDLNSSATSGENNWTARKRLFYYDVNQPVMGEDGQPAVDDKGQPVYTAVYPFGFVAEDNTENVIHRWVIADTDMTEEKAAATFEGVTLWNGLAAQVLQGIGLTQNATKNNYNTVKFKGIGANDIVIVNTINSYGSNSIHPVCATADEYFAQVKGEDVAFPIASTGREVLGNKAAGAYVIDEEDGTKTLGFQLYRIDTALVYAKVFGVKGGGTGIENIGTAENAQNAGAYYNLAGQRIAKPAKGSIFIHNGKKMIMK